MKTNRTTGTWFRLAVLGGLVSLAVLAMEQVSAATKKTDKGGPLQRATSKDGTRIAYQTSGEGPALILVGGALSARTDAAPLAQLLASQFTVYSYDRRGRGDSTDTTPYSVDREIEDIEALIDVAGGSAYVYGKSSGASLALEAAAALGNRITKLALYEAPYSGAKGAAKEWRAFTAKLDGLLAAGRREDAITEFMRFVGAPDEAIAKMKASPAWPRMVAMAPTLAYDNAVVGADRAVPVDKAAQVKASTLVMDGGASAGPMPFMRASANKIAKAIPNARRQTIEGQAHDVSAEVLAPILLAFFG